MTKQRSLWPIIRRVWITVGLGATVIFVTWSLLAYRASPDRAACGLPVCTR